MLLRGCLLAVSALAAGTVSAAAAAAASLEPLEQRDSCCDLCFDISPIFLKVYITEQTLTVPTLYDAVITQNGVVNLGGKVKRP